MLFNAPSSPEIARYQDALKLTLEASRMGIWEWDVESGQIYWSDGAFQLLGYQAGEVEPSWEAWRQRVNADDFLQAQSRLSAILQEPLEFRNEYRVIHPDGKIRWIDSRGRSEWKDGKIRRLFGVVIDIQPMKELEQHLRTEKERQERLSHTLSHDLRDPLTVIQGHAELALAADPGSVRQNLEAILKGAEQMNEMIENLVTVARLESGQMRPDLQPTNVSDWLHNLRDRLETAFDTGRLYLEPITSEHWAKIDVTQMEKLVYNLVSNALKFSPADSAVWIRCRPAEGNLVVSVCDQGIGILPEEIPSLFTRHFRTERSKGVDGIGLGLYIAKLLAKAHGGRIWADSRPEETIFSVSLPLIDGIHEPVAELST